MKFDQLIESDQTNRFFTQKSSLVSNQWVQSVIQRSGGYFSQKISNMTKTGSKQLKGHDLYARRENTFCAYVNKRTLKFVHTWWVWVGLHLVLLAFARMQRCAKWSVCFAVGQLIIVLFWPEVLYSYALRWAILLFKCVVP